MPIANLSDIQQKLLKRGFKMHSPLLSRCETCSADAVATYLIAGKSGGRDITLCHECGHARSWRSAPGLEERTEDTSFKLDEFLK
jgi:hypothetical protein